MVLLAVPAAYVARRLIETGFPRLETGLALLTCVLLLIPEEVWQKLAFALSGWPVPVNGTVTLDPVPAFLTMGPAIGTVMMYILVSRIGSHYNQRIDSVSLHHLENRETQSTIMEA
jgi:hypothetical protein